MPQPRKFDHDEARLRYAAGESGTSLAKHYGVHPTAIYRLVTPGLDERMRRAAREVYYAGTCEVCGGSCLSIRHPAKRAHSPDGRELCARCRGDEMTERFRFDDAGVLVAVRCGHEDCASGERWQPPKNFGRGPRSIHIREGGIRRHCRSCETRARRDYRRRNPEKEAAINHRAREARRARSVS